MISCAVSGESFNEPEGSLRRVRGGQGRLSSRGPGKGAASLTTIRSYQDCRSDAVVEEVVVARGIGYDRSSMLRVGNRRHWPSKVGDPSPGRSSETSSHRLREVVDVHEHVPYPWLDKRVSLNLGKMH